MLVEIIRELTKCEENIAKPSKNILTRAKREEAQRVQMVVISSLQEAKNLMLSYKNIPSTERKDQKEIHWALEVDVNTADKNTIQDDAQCMARDVTNVASSTSKKYAEVPGAVWSIPLKRKLYTNKSLASKW